MKPFKINNKNVRVSSDNLKRIKRESKKASHKETVKDLLGGIALMVLILILIFAVFAINPEAL